MAKKTYRRQIDISTRAFDENILSTLTNEIPHLSIYDILNSNLRDDWSRQFVGKATADHTSGELLSEKMMNGEKVKDYLPKVVTFSNVEDNKIYKAEIGKINFSVDGAIESEMDYLMHENARYLSKLYPDNINTLQTLTEAERQSYINEALHMIHSYFDTEQITVRKAFDDLYYRYRFLTGIAAIRAQTGTTIQEEQLLSLINTGNLIVYSGYKIFVSETSISTITNNYDLALNQKLLRAVFNGFFYHGLTDIFEKALIRISGKVRDVGLRDFVENSSTLYDINPTFLDNVRTMYLIDTEVPMTFIKWLIDGCKYNSVNINQWFADATDLGQIKAGSTVEGLKNTKFGSQIKLDFDVKKEPLYVIFSTEADSAQLVLLSGRTLTYKKVTDFDNKILISSDLLPQIHDTIVLQLGKAQFTDTACKALGNIVYSNLVSEYLSSQRFARVLDLVLKRRDNFQGQITVKQAGKLLFAGILNKSTFTNEFKLVPRYEYSTFDPQLVIENLFSHVLKKQLIEEIQLDTQQEFEISFQIIYLETAKIVTEKIAYVVHDNKNFPDAENVRFFLFRILDHNVVVDYDVFLKRVNTITDDDETWEGNLKNGRLYRDANKSEYITCEYVSENEFVINNIKYEIDQTGQVYQGSDLVGEVFATQDEQYLHYDPATLKHCVVKKVDLINSEGNAFIESNFEWLMKSYHPKGFLSKASPIINSLELTIQWYEMLQKLIEDNTVSTTEMSLARNKMYIYATKLIPNQTFTVPTNIIDNLRLAEHLFKNSQADWFNLETYSCEIYGKDVVRVREDVSKLIRQLGVVNCLLLDEEANKHIVTAIKTQIKDDYCYIYFSRVSPEITSKDVGKKGLITLDNTQKHIKQKLRIQSTVKEKQRLADRTILKLDRQRFFFRYVWEDLTRSNLNFYFDNIYSKNTKVYGDKELISLNTRIPQTLSDVEFCTVVDIQDLNQNIIKLVKDLIKENKSLYLDSSIKILQNVPLGLKSLVYNPQYDLCSYMHRTDIVAYITFYNVNNYLNYAPLKEFLEMDKTKDGLDLEDARKFYDRKKIIWGSVVWDANVEREIPVFRTIWSGFFTNFDIQLSDDIIPDESILPSLDSKIYEKSQAVINYEYAFNGGNPGLDWSFVALFAKNNISSKLVNMVDCFSHSEVKNASPKVNVIFDDESDQYYVQGNRLYINSYYFQANRLNLAKNRLELKVCKCDARTINLQGLKLDHVVLDEKAVTYSYQSRKYEVQIKNQETAGNFFLGQRYRINLIYNMLHYDEDTNFTSSGIFTKHCYKDTALEMYLDFIVYQFYCLKILGYKKLEDFPENYISIYKIVESFKNEKTWSEAFQDYFISSFYDSDVVDTDKAWLKYSDEKEIVLKDAIEYAATLNYVLPGVALLKKNGDVEISYFRLVKLENGRFVIYEGTSLEKANGDLISSLLSPQYQYFQVRPSLYYKVSAALHKYQYTFPNKVLGEFVGLDINIVDKDSFGKMVSRDIKEKVLQQDLVDIFTKNFRNLEDSVIELNSTKYRLQSTEKNFREYMLDTVQLSVEDLPDDDQVSNIKRCNVTFNNLKNLRSEGYLYLFDIRASNRRSNYSNDREMQIVDRSFELENLHLLAFQIQDTKRIRFLLQDSNLSYTKNIQNVLPKITPLDEKLKEQLISDKQLSIGYNWEDPEIDIDYTYYKRKFVTEGVINAVRPTVIELADENLKQSKNTFDLNNHISIGDPIQLYVLNTSSYFQEGQTVTFTVDKGTYTGPYKVIYSKTTVEPGSESPKALQQVVLSGPGNIVYAEIDLANNKMFISDPYYFDSTKQQFAYLLNDAFTIYDQQTTFVFGQLDTYLDSKGDIAKLDFEDPKETVNAAGLASPEENDQISKTLLQKHENWYVFNESLKGFSNTTSAKAVFEKIPKGKDEAKEESFEAAQNPPPRNITPILLEESIPYRNLGYINYDNFGRVYFEPNDPEQVQLSRWLSAPDEAELFDISNDTFTELDASKNIQNVPINDATDIQLKSFIRRTLTDLFDDGSSASKILDSGIPTENAGDVNNTDNLNLPDTSSNSITLTATSHIDAGKVYLARILYNAAVGQRVELATAPIYVPQIADYDLPVYFDGVKCKYRRVAVFTGTSKKLEDASIEELRRFARAILPTSYISRRNSRVTSYTRTNKYFVTWDQTTGCLTISDKLGNYQKRLAIPQIGYFSPITDQTPDKKEVKAWSISNTLFARSSINDYVAQANDKFKVDNVGIYNLFTVPGNKLYLPELFATYKDKDVDEELKSKIADENARKIAASLIKFVFSSEYAKYWSSNIVLDCMSTANCEFVSFKDSSHVCSFKNLLITLNALGMDMTTCSKVAELLQSTTIPRAFKGLPYFTKQDADFWTKNPLYSASYSSSKSFISCIKTSGVEVTENKVHIYGIINWPDDRTFDAIRTDLNTKIASSTPVSAKYKDLIAAKFVGEIQTDLKVKYAAFTGSESYKAGETPFKVTVDLNTLDVLPVQMNTVLQGKNLAIESMRASSENITSLTQHGTFNYGDEAQRLLKVEETEIFKTKISSATLQVYEGIKDLDIFSRFVQAQSDGSLKIALSGTSIMNAQTVYSTVLKIDKKSFEIKDDVMLLNPGEVVNVIVLAKDLTKDNFQFGYGEVTNLNMIPAAATLFEVANSNYADFASYENKYSSEKVVISKDLEGNDVERTTKDTVFEIYPSFETVDVSLRKHFYELSEEKPEYVINKYGRNVLRITSVVGTFGGGQIFYRTPIDKKLLTYTETLANEAITDQFLAENIKKIDKFCMLDERSYSLGYSEMIKKYSLQKIVKLVQEPHNAVLSFPYKKFLLDTSSGKIEVYKDYIILEASKETDFDLRDLEKLLNSTTNKFAVANCSQTIDLLESCKDYKENDLKDVAKAPETKKHFDTNGDLLGGSYIDFSGIRVHKVETDTIKSWASIDTVIKNDLISSTYSVPYTGHLEGEWISIQKNSSIVILNLKIINRTETLPKFVPITKYRTKLDSDKNLVIDTVCNEIYVNSYGQAILGKDTLPVRASHLFDDKIFYDFSKKTLNAQGNEILVVNEKAESLEVNLPKLMYNSFAQADAALPKDLPTTKTIKSVNSDVLIDLTKFNTTSASLHFQDSTKFAFIPLVSSNVQAASKELENTELYNLFKNNIKFSCKVAWSELGPDATKQVFQVSKKLEPKLSYTRKYKSKLIPANYRYLFRDGTYRITSGNLVPDLKRYSADEDGNVLFYDRNGQLTTRLGINPPIPALRKANTLTFFESNFNLITAIVEDSFCVAQNSIGLEFNTNTIIAEKANQQKSILCIRDPNKSASFWSTISSSLWKEKDIPINWKFNTLSINLKYKEDVKSYNFAYLKNVKNEPVAKIFFQNKINEDSVLLFSSVI